MRTRQRHRLLPLVLLGASFAALAGTFTGRLASKGTRNGAERLVLDGLLIEPTHLDFGEVWGTPDFAVRLPIRNVTDRDLHIREFRTGCNCRPVEPKSLLIPAGATHEIRLILDSSKQSPAKVGQPWRVEAEIRPIFLGRPSAKAWVVRGTIRPLIATDLPAVLFGESNLAGEPPVARRIRVQFRAAGVPGVEVVPPCADAKVLPGDSPTEWTVEVAPHTDRPPGPFQGTLTVTNRSPDGQTPIASLALPVEGVLLEAAK